MVIKKKINVFPLTRSTKQSLLLHINVNTSDKEHEPSACLVILYTTRVQQKTTDYCCLSLEMFPISKNLPHDCENDAALIPSICQLVSLSQKCGSTFPKGYRYKLGAGPPWLRAPLRGVWKNTHKCKLSRDQHVQQLLVQMNAAVGHNAWSWFARYTPATGRFCCQVRQCQEQRTPTGNCSWDGHRATQNNIQGCVVRSLLL